MKAQNLGNSIVVGAKPLHTKSTWSNSLKTTTSRLALSRQTDIGLDKIA